MLQCYGVFLFGPCRRDLELVAISIILEATLSFAKWVERSEVEGSKKHNHDGVFCLKELHLHFKKFRLKYR